MSTPLVSCLTVTSDRLLLLKEAIACYCAQTWERRELVVVAAGTRRYRAAVADYARALARDDIRVIPVDEPASLGRLRNLSLDHARGELVCQWDDDDLYHPDRVRVQVDALLRADARGCFLTEHLQLFTEERALYWIDWKCNPRLPLDQQLVPGTLVARRHPSLRYPESGRDAGSGEDNVVRTAVVAGGAVAPTAGHGPMYIYRFHGRNVTPREHHEHITGWGALDAAALVPARATLDRALAGYRLPLPCVVKARGGQPLFTYNGGP
jgi:glycosyltransferase involved in cell wall biosynthesis